MLNHILVLSILFASDLFAETEVELPLLTKTGAPAEVLMDDPIVPARHGRTSLNSSAGSLQNSLQNQVPIPVTDSGSPGNLGQVRGWGPSAEDVDVQAFGLSLSPPQGGGFDLSIFPQYLWSDFSFQSGPALNSMNQSAASGTLSLTPWTVRAVKDPGFGVKGVEFYSSLGVNQLSVAAHQSPSDDRGGGVAAVAGYSSARVVGPSGGVSAVWNQGEFGSGSVHLLATDLDAQTPGPSDYPTPLGRTRNTRVIPILQQDFRLSKSSLLKTSFFYDWARLDYSNPEVAYTSRSRTQQGGVEAAYLVEDWKFGFNAREVRYESSFGNAPVQDIGTFQASRSIEAGTFLFEPMIQGIWVNGYGLLPQGTLGGRHEWDHGHYGVYSRVSFSRRIPSLIDRYFLSPEFTGNQDLKMERDWTGILGWEFKGDRLESSVQAYAQLRQDARVLLDGTVKNLGTASVMSVSVYNTGHLNKAWDTFNALTFSHSHLNAIGSEFPYVPTWSGLWGANWRLNPLGSEYEQGSLWGAWQWNAVARIFSSRTYSPSTENRLGGYLVVDTGLTKVLGRGLSVTGRVENLADREVEGVKGYRFGRSFSVLLAGEI